jgi:hypothetical protein
MRSSRAPAKRGGVAGFGAATPAEEITMDEPTAPDPAAPPADGTPGSAVFVNPATGAVSSDCADAEPYLK